MGIKFANYGQQRDLNATAQEIEIFEIIKEMAAPADLELLRKSKDYVTAALGEWDLVRIKYTDRAKWIAFPTVESGSKKHRITTPTDVKEYADLLADSITHIRKYSN